MTGMKTIVNALLRSPEGILMIRKPSTGFWFLPGGKLEPGESPEEGVVREVFEETGLRPLEMRLRGEFILRFVDNVKEERKLYTFEVSRWEGDVDFLCREGSLAWQKVEHLDFLPMPDGDRRAILELLGRESFLHGEFLYREDYTLVAHRLTGTLLV
ncbi:MAG: NUDIX domain-containing protein [Brockia lithotrophica]|nr:NUDIX domain-containing protein [Brockia lithotrophica]